MPNTRGRFTPHGGGPIPGATPGRNDRHRLSVGSGSFVLPSDIPSALGEGNSISGHAILNRMFPQPPRRMADGGEVEGEEVPIIAASGEYVISPDQVAAVGDGDLDKGHKVLNAFVKHTRNAYIRHLRKLPAPKV